MNKKSKKQVFSRLGNTKKTAGFTLIEILVVMVIMGVLAAIGLGNFASSQRKARDARRKSDLKQIANALESYYNDYGQYPDEGAGGGTIAGCGSVDCTWGGVFQDDNGTVYMVRLPNDPVNGRTYEYDSDGTYFRIYALLENELDRDVASYPSTDCSTSGSEACNYGIASPNATP